MAKGFTQRPGVDNFETYAPVARIEFIKGAIARSAEQELILKTLMSLL